MRSSACSVAVSLAVDAQPTVVAKQAAAVPTLVPLLAAVLTPAAILAASQRKWAALLSCVHVALPKRLPSAAAKLPVDVPIAAKLPADVPIAAKLPADVPIAAMAAAAKQAAVAQTDVKGLLLFTR